MIYCPGDKNLISVSWDRSIVVHDESAGGVHRRATNSHKARRFGRVFIVFFVVFTSACFDFHRKTDGFGCLGERCFKDRTRGISPAWPTVGTMGL